MINKRRALKLGRALRTDIRTVPLDCAPAWGCGASEINWLTHLDLVAIISTSVKNIEPPIKPVAKIGPGLPLPDPKELSKFCIRRWEEADYVERRLLVSTKRGRRVFGGSVHVDPRALTHDMCVGILYARVLQEAPELIRTFEPEDDRRKELRAFEKLPDLMFAGVAWEFLGSYPFIKCLELVRFAELTNLQMLLF